MGWDKEDKIFISFWILIIIGILLIVNKGCDQRHEEEMKQIEMKVKK